MSAGAGPAGGHGRELRPLWRASGALALVVLGQLVWQRTQAGPAALLTAAVDVLQVVMAGAAAWACLRRSRLVATHPLHDDPARNRYELLAWRLVGAGAASWGLGQVVWTWDEVVLGLSVPFPSLADVGYLGFPVLAGIGAGLLARARVRFDSGLRAMLDGLLVSGALLMISWQTVLASVVQGADRGLPLAVSLAYPIGDLAILALVVLLIGRTPSDVALRLLAAGLSTLAIADSAFVWLTASGRFATGGVVDATWVTAFGLVGLIAWAPPATCSDSPDHGPGRFALLLPSVPLLIGLGSVVVDLWRGEPIGRLLTVTVTVLVLALVVRQSLSAVENATLVRRLRVQEARLRRLAYDDALTGVANRGRFTEELLRRAQEASALGRPLTVAYIDLNGFKAVNDRLGHVAGDVLLRTFAGRLRDAVDSGDLVARLGGDEFALLIGPDRTPDPPAVRRLVLDTLRLPFVLDGEPTPVTAAVGVVQEQVRGTDEQTADDLLRAADARMYEDKVRLRSSAAGPGHRTAGEVDLYSASAGGLLPPHGRRIGRGSSR
ncbi:GGDEF domain-containing protein [Cellulomonas citrea]|uniref:GGDEF domain-containing protein n=1 Tax=Cellulomonas citrea TaxID=1909423 RepID=UPI00135AAE97|nr:GGDEF domain-containing protein [Cellulomonas citrea]